MELKTLKNIVWNILDKKEDARSDDFVLYLYVCDDIGIYTHITLKNFLLGHIIIKAPTFESVTRCRRKWQEKHPELIKEKTKEARRKQEEEYIKLSKE